MEEGANYIGEIADLYKHLTGFVKDRKSHLDEVYSKILLAFNYNSYKMHDAQVEEKKQKKPKGLDESIAVFRALEEAGIIKNTEKNNSET